MKAKEIDIDNIDIELPISIQKAVITDNIITISTDKEVIEINSNGNDIAKDIILRDTFIKLYLSGSNQSIIYISKRKDLFLIVHKHNRYSYTIEITDINEGI